MKKYHSIARKLYNEYARYAKPKKSTGSSSQWLRERLACSQSDFSLLLGFSREMLSQTERATKNLGFAKDCKLSVLTNVVLNAYPALVGDRYAAQPDAETAALALLDDFEISTQELEAERDGLATNIRLMEAVLKQREQEAAQLLTAYKHLAAHDLSKFDELGADDEHWKRIVPMHRIRMKLKAITGRAKMEDEIRLAEWRARLAYIENELAVRTLLEPTAAVDPVPAVEPNAVVVGSPAATTHRMGDAQIPHPSAEGENTRQPGSGKNENRHVWNREVWFERRVPRVITPIHSSSSKRAHHQAVLRRA